MRGLGFVFYCLRLIPKYILFPVGSRDFRLFSLYLANEALAMGMVLEAHMVKRAGLEPAVPGQIPNSLLSRFLRELS